MLDKKAYLDLKKEVKCLCRKNVISLCDEIELNEEERKLLMYFYDGKSKVQTCMDLSVSPTYYNNHMKILFTKINDYKNTFK